MQRKLWMLARESICRELPTELSCRLTREWRVRYQIPIQTLFGPLRCGRQTPDPKMLLDRRCLC